MAFGDDGVVPVSRFTDDIYSFFEAVTGLTPHNVKRASGKALCNEVWDISSGRDSLILRLNHKHELDTYHKEAWCMEAAAKVGIPSAVPIGSGINDGTAWMLQSKIEGTVGSEWSGNPLQLWKQLGRLSAMLHTIPVGGYWDDIQYSGKQLSPVKSWSECLDARIEHLFGEDLFLRHRVFTAEQNQLAKDTVGELYKLDFSPVLVHFDLTPKNTIMGASGEVSLIDYEGAGGGYGAISELATIATFDKGPGVVKAYCDGYGISGDQFECMQAPLSQISLLRALSHIHYSWRNRPGEQAPFFDAARDKCFESMGLGQVLEKPANDLDADLSLSLSDLPIPLRAPLELLL